MISLKRLGRLDDEDPRWAAALRRALPHFLGDAPLSVRTATALERTAKALGVRTLRDICNPQGDALLRQFGGRRD